MGYALRGFAFGLGIFTGHSAFHRLLKVKFGSSFPASFVIAGVCYLIGEQERSIARRGSERSADAA